MSTRDFRATQVRTHAIIGSGSSPQLLLYPSSSATNQYGGVDLPGTGSDTWMFVSGAVGTSSGKVVFGGDIVVSGSINAIGGVQVPAYFSSTSTGAIFTTGSAAFRGTENSVDDPRDKGADVFFYVSGTVGGAAATSKKALLGGDTVISGSVRIAGNQISGSAGGSITLQSTGIVVSGITGSNVSVTGDATIGSTIKVTGNQISGSAGGSITLQSTGILVSGITGSNVSVSGDATVGSTIKVTGNQISGSAGGNITLQSTGIVVSGITGSNALISGNVTVGGDFTVNGTTTTVNTTNLLIKDPLLLIGSGATSSGANGGIALASGSNESNKALVFGRIASDTWGAGKQDVTNGTTTSLTGMDLVGLRAGKLEIGGSTAYLTGVTGATTIGVMGTNLVLSSNKIFLTGSIEAGLGSRATGNQSHAEGNTSIASGYYAHSEGFGAVASGENSHAEGYASTASGYAAHSEGRDTLASGYVSHAEGQGTTSALDYSHAEGLLTVASGTHSHAEGQSTVTIGAASHAEGLGSIAQGAYSHAAGTYTIASGSGQFVVGKYNKRGDDTSLFIVGNGTGDANANRSDVFRVLSGTLNNGRVEVTGSFISSRISGSLTNLADGRSFIVAGSNVTVTSASDGQITIASSGGGSDAYFSSTTAGSIFTTGSAAFIGAESAIDSPSDKGADVFFYVSGTVGGVASSSKKSVFGGDVRISGSLSQGSATIASGDYSHAIGVSTLASGYGSVSMGIFTTGSGVYSHAQGWGSVASGQGSHAEGYASRATNSYSHAEGNTTTASGPYSHAEGSNTTASGSYSHAGGISTIASGSGQTVYGKYNLRGNDYSLFVIGNGSGETNANRSDVIRVETTGLQVTGSLYVSSGISGSHTSLADGRSLLVAGSNVTITTASDGQITIASSGGGGGTPGGSNTYIQFNNAGSFGGDSGLTYDQSTDTLKTTIITASLGFSGSHTSLNDGRSFLVAGSNVTITTASDGQITIASSGGGGGSPGGSDTYIQFNNAGSFGGDSGLTYDQSTDTLKATVVTASLGFSGSLTRLSDGSSYLRAGTSSSMAQTGSISVTSASNGAVTVNAYVFPNDITISLSGGRTFGRYASGETIPATGKTPAEVILLATAEPIAPTVPTPTATNPITSTWNTTGSITTSVTASYTINSLGASVSTATLQFRSGSSGAWNTLSTSTTNPLKYDHTFTVGTNFTTVLNYQYIVLDSAGAAATGSVNLTPQSYTAPTIGTLTMARSTVNGITGESNTTRERGNVFSEITGTITRNRTNAQLSSYAVQYSVNGGAYSNVTGFSGSITGNPATFTFSGSHNDVALKTSVTSSLAYRVSVVDTWTTSSVTPSSPTITFYSAIFYGTASAAPTTSADVRSLGNKVFTTTGDPFNLLTGITNRFFVVALPTRETSHDTIASVTDTSALNANITTSYVNSPFGVEDGGGVSSTYNVYTMEIATPYSPTEHTHSVDRA